MLVSSAIFTRMVGKYDGAVIMPNGSATVARVNVVPANPKTPGQVAVRQAFVATTSAYRNLTLAQLDAWEAAAATVTASNALGIQYTLHGLQLFQKVNALRQWFGLDVKLTPPNPLTGPNRIGTDYDTAADGAAINWTWPAGDPSDPFLNTGQVRIYVASRPITVRRMAGSWDSHTDFLSGVAHVDPGATGFNKSAAAPTQRVFYRCIATGKNGEIIDAIQSSFLAA